MKALFAQKAFYLSIQILPRHRPTEEVAWLAVSGRCGWFRALVGISATTTLAVQLAERYGMALAAFARGERCTIYAHAERFGFPSLCPDGLPG